MNKYIILMLSIFLLSFVSAGMTYQVNTEINVTVICLNNGYCSSDAYCNINIEDPTGNLTVQNQNMTKDSSFFYYTMNVNETGKFFVTGFCKDGTDSDEIDFSFDVTENGKPVASNISVFMIAMVFLIFLISCFFMYMSSKATQGPFKVFFFLSSIIFLMASLLTGYMVASDGNISSNITSTTLALVIVVGSILFIFFLIVIIKETIFALDMLRVKQGKEWKINPGSRMTGNRETIY